MKGALAGIWSGLTSGGTATHTHDMPDVIAHQHSVVEETGVLTPAGDGEHFHDVYKQLDQGEEVNMGGLGLTGRDYVPGSDAGAHTHSVTVPADTADNTGTTPANSNAESTFPSYKNLRVCRKD